MTTVTCTTNGDLAHASVGSPLLDFFGGVCRKSNKLDLVMETHIAQLMPRCWDEDALRTLKMLFYKRDCREGAGERRIFELGFEWVLTHHSDAAIVNIARLIEYGSFKDVAKLLASPVAQTRAAEILARNLQSDIVALQNKQPLSLAAKWAPSLKSELDRKFGAARQVAHAMKLGHNWQQKYRKTLSELRSHLEVTEHMMSAGLWTHINYSHVPSIAMQRYRTAFQRHSPEQWCNYLANITRGTAKVNAKQLMPHEILRQNLNDPLTEHQWKAMVDAVRKRGSLQNAIAMCDVSSSMRGLPMDVSVALGCLVSEISETNRDLLISFSATPKFFDLYGKSLSQRVAAIKEEVGYNTCVVSAFRALLDRAKNPNFHMPGKIIIISDMQFDQSDPLYNATSYETIKECYISANQVIPRIVYWNVQGLVTAFPVNQEDKGTCVVSGFSQNILNSVMQDITDPRSIMMAALDSERYDSVVLP